MQKVYMWKWTGFFRLHFALATTTTTTTTTSTTTITTTATTTTTNTTTTATAICSTLSSEFKKIIIPSLYHSENMGSYTGFSLKSGIPQNRGF